MRGRKARHLSFFDVRAAGYRSEVEMFLNTAITQARHSFRFLRSIFCLAFVSTTLICNFVAAERTAYATDRPVARLVTAAQPVPKARLVVAAPIKSAPVTTAVPSAAMVFVATSDEQRAFDLINAQRVENGMKPLVWDEQVFHVARLHSESMAHEDFFAHTNTEGLDAASRARRAGLKGWNALGENISYNQGFDDPSAFAVERWMQSVKHRANILRAEFTHAGLGVARAADGRVFFTQVFVTR